MPKVFRISSDLKPDEPEVGRRYLYRGREDRRWGQSSPGYSSGAMIAFLSGILAFCLLATIGVFLSNPFAARLIFESGTDVQVILPCATKSPLHNERHNAVSENSIASKNYKYYFFGGRKNFTQAVGICRSLRGQLISPQTPADEEAVDRLVASPSLSDLMFTDDYRISGLQRMVWTGGYFNLETDNGTRIHWFDGRDPPQWHQNWCRPREAFQFLASLQKDRIANPVGSRGNPIVHIMKNYQGRLFQAAHGAKPGCWELLSAELYDMEQSQFYLTCQVNKAFYPFHFIKNVIGLFRYRNSRLLAKTYALFTGSGNYSLAREECQRIAGGAVLLTTNTLNRDYDVDTHVLKNYEQIFGIDDGRDKRRQMIWTGGYYNLTSRNPLKVRWTTDPEAEFDIEKHRILYFGQKDEPDFVYDNYCAPVAEYHKMINKTLEEEREAAKYTGCLENRLYLIVKDYRPGQAVKGCWDVVDLKYMVRHGYKLNLVCELPDVIEYFNNGTNQKFYDEARAFYESDKHYTGLHKYWSELDWGTFD